MIKIAKIIENIYFLDFSNFFFQNIYKNEDQIRFQHWALRWKTKQKKRTRVQY